MRQWTLVGMLLLITSCVTGAPPQTETLTTDPPLTPELPNGCTDGDDYISYYPDAGQTLTFPGEFAPSPTLTELRVAYEEYHRCRESAAEGKFIRARDGQFRKVSDGEFTAFLEQHNRTCNGCLREHYDGCC